MDFSTIALRKIYCEKEIQLNSRYSDIYLGIEPIFLKDGDWIIGGKGNKPLDYAVVMRKMDDEKRMDRKIESGEIGENSIVDLAHIIARFHLLASRINKKFDLLKAKKLFNDIASVPDLLDGVYKKDDISSEISFAINKSNVFLERNQHVFQRRIDYGLKRDLHGDLHCENVFLGNPPVIFDCLEFNDEYRQIDVLYDFAFLTMDLESWGRGDLSMLLEATYEKSFDTISLRDSAKVYNYFKCLRANVRSKIMAVKLSQTTDEQAKCRLYKSFDRYYSLFIKYAHLIGA
ncbi:hypothetical protein LZF95_06105 [Algoriphagus sp. AGSA1]|nr:hypothetical protein [Algoriphagus sp. AGSA1]